MKLIHTPRFFDPAKAGQWYKPDIAASMREGIEFGKANHLRTANHLIMDGRARLLAITDLQSDFRDAGRLPVKGTDDVVLRVCERLLNGIVADYYGGIMFSLDGHGFFHISFDSYWRDENGVALDLSKHGGAAILTLDGKYPRAFRAQAFGPNGPYDVGYYRAVCNENRSVDYWNHLQSTGQGPIWAFVPHCVLGTDGVDLHPLLAETIAFACGARNIQPAILRKGHIPDTDWFGPLEPCRPDDADGFFRDNVVREMARYTDVEFVGVAEDFCDFHMKRQVLSTLNLIDADRLCFVTDCTAPIVPNAAHVLEQNAKAKALGVRFIRHDTPFAES